MKIREKNIFSLTTFILDLSFLFLSLETLGTYTKHGWSSNNGRSMEEQSLVFVALTLRPHPSHNQLSLSKKGQYSYEILLNITIKLENLDTIKEKKNWQPSFLSIYHISASWNLDISLKIDQIFIHAHHRKSQWSTHELNHERLCNNLFYRKL